MPKEGESNYCEVCTQEGSALSVIKVLCNAYNERIRELLSGNMNNTSPINVGCPSINLLNCGLPNLPIQISVSKLLEKKDQCNHIFKFIDILHLPEFIFAPIAIFRSAKKVDDVKVILTEMTCKEANIVVIIYPNQLYKGTTVNSIRSIYPKDSFKEILYWVVEDNLLEYVNKEKFLNWLGKQQSHSADVTKLIKECSKIINEM